MNKYYLIFLISIIIYVLFLLLILIVSVLNGRTKITDDFSNFAQLNENISSTQTEIAYSGNLNAGNFAKIDDEFVFVKTVANFIATVNRGTLGTAANSHSKGTYFRSVSDNKVNEMIYGRSQRNITKLAQILLSMNTTFAYYFVPFILLLILMSGYFWYQSTKMSDAISQF